MNGNIKCRGSVKPYAHECLINKLNKVANSFNPVNPNGRMNKGKEVYEKPSTTNNFHALLFK